MKAVPIPILVTLLTLSLTMALSSESDAQLRSACTVPFADADSLAFAPYHFATTCLLPPSPSPPE
jgi:hypothetical protein